MRTLAQEPEASPQIAAARSLTPGRTAFTQAVGSTGSNAGVNSILHLQRTIGNQAVQRILAARSAQESGADAKRVSQKGIENEDDARDKAAAAKRGCEKERVGAFGRTTAAPVLQRGPDGGVPAPVHVPPPAGRAALNFLPVMHDAAPASWGVTINDDAVFDITAYADGAVWKCKITTADQQSHQGVRLLPGVVEVTPALVAGEANCGTLQTMITSLNSVASQGADSGFYMLAAVQAHEDVHITQYRAGLAPHYATLRTAIEALTVPLAGSADAGAAKAAIQALPAYTTAMATFHAADVAVNNASGAHSPVAPFNTAEHGVVDPMIANIRARRTALTCH